MKPIAENFPAYEVSNKRMAMALHREMQANGASIVRTGEFYTSMLRRGLWPNQAAMAAGLAVSASNVSRCMTAARLPVDLVDAAGGDTQITFSLAERFDFLVKQLGINTVSERARRLPRGLSVPEIEHALLTGAPPLANEVTISVAKNGTHLIIESARLQSILGDVPNIAKLFNAMLRTK
ncbi:hypothetical protein [Burkholderia cenocepacia]|uniref:hypothetical protein n=1 Tax=Burkholderia cenocepacia TaxID=95486 RepID=UPI00097CAD2D|nr:hypothetical protein [Burkholderia cenocepacia]ONJ29036.1 hypothetical protein A8D82_00040 [Burkholderia cenocepacia]ONN93939.1 hypothetical protein A8D64_04595 [Burkholderia cenocepacia]ONN97010.1 hypothetical protein A8D63_02130 [Burkholderia cenocepacia]ONN99117.1 hypothetical protein A8D62_02675 [Burkholderia cenocepacia]ONO11616.1 hypothetical protein A8D67_09880 [Burkholderia cenocepacia]